MTALLFAELNSARERSSIKRLFAATNPCCSKKDAPDRAAINRPLSTSLDAGSDDDDDEDDDDEEDDDDDELLLLSSPSPSSLGSGASVEGMEEIVTVAGETEGEEAYLPLLLLLLILLLFSLPLLLLRARVRVPTLSSSLARDEDSD